MLVVVRHFPLLKVKSHRNKALLIAGVTGLVLVSSFWMADRTGGDPPPPLPPPPPVATPPPPVQNIEIVFDLNGSVSYTESGVDGKDIPAKTIDAEKIHAAIEETRDRDRNADFRVTVVYNNDDNVGRPEQVLEIAKEVFGERLCDGDIDVVIEYGTPNNEK